MTTKDGKEGSMKISKSDNESNKSVLLCDLRSN